MTTTTSPVPLIQGFPQNGPNDATFSPLTSPTPTPASSRVPSPKDGLPRSKSEGSISSLTLLQKINDIALEELQAAADSQN